MHKLSRRVDAGWVEHVYASHYARAIEAKPPRLVAGVPGATAEPFERLIACLAPPYFLLYVLHTPRGEGEPGRYQSAHISADEFAAFMTRFRTYLVTDARFDLWIHSPSDQATVVWDRHNRLHAYGPLDLYEDALARLGYVPGECAMPDPHAHHYHAANDGNAAALLAWCDWHRTPLQPDDEQMDVYG